MTSLLGRLLPLFVGARRVEDLFTETVARLFERRPDLCLAWLEDLDLVTSASEGGRRYVRVTTQKSFVALEEHDSGSRPDLIVEVHHAAEDAELESSIEVVMIESKIGSVEGEDQLKRYAGHLSGMSGTRKTLVYMTRAYDPKDKNEILSEVDGICFKQLRWHDFYRFLQEAEKDTLVEEIGNFMEEQGMASSYRFSTTDLMAVSGVSRAFEIIDETIDEEVKRELESFAGRKVKCESGSLMRKVREDGGYFIYASLTQEDDFGCYLGYEMGALDGYPKAQIGLWADPSGARSEESIAVVNRVSDLRNWESYDPEDPESWPEVWREASLANLLIEVDHVAAVRTFFIESIRQLREELTAFKQEHPELPWSAGRVPDSS